MRREHAHSATVLLCLISNAIGPRTVCVQSDVDCTVQPPFWLLTFIQQHRRTRRSSWVKGSSHTTLFLFCCLLVGLSVRIIRLLSDVFLSFFLSFSALLCSTLVCLLLLLLLLLLYTVHIKKHSIYIRDSHSYPAAGCIVHSCPTWVC